ncbi:hypothetical protein ACFQ08_45235, partial [Streptosporangium algeriense]
ALRRLLDFYLASAQSAHRLAYDGSTLAEQLSVTGPGHTFASADEAVAWLTIEAESLFATVAQTTAHTTARATAHTAAQAAHTTVQMTAQALLAAADLLLAMEPLLESGSHAREFERRARETLAAAQRFGAPSSELRCRYVLGRVLFGSNRLVEARKEFEASLGLAVRGRHAGVDEHRLRRR